MRSKNLTFLLLILLCFSPCAFALPPAQQQAGGQQGLLEQQERERKLREKVEQPRLAPENQQETTSSQAPVSNEKTLVTKIIVTGNTLLPQWQIDAIIRPFEGKELRMVDMQKVADLVTDAYRKKGFITTRAIIPPQKVENATLEIKVVIGLMGDLTVRGNHYFKAWLFKRRVTLHKGEPFNYTKLQSDLYNINQYPDRNVKTVLTPGQNPGETDVLFNVKDQLPIHIGISYDNFGSKYLGPNRFTGTVTDNNLLGLDDILTFQYQDATEEDAYKLESLRYLLPVTSTTQVGVYGNRNQLQLQDQFKILQSRGKSDIYGTFVNQTLYNQPDLKIVSDVGFDYKNVYNFLGGSLSSRDIERVLKAGINIDYSDAFMGRNIVNDEVDFGIPHLFGGAGPVEQNLPTVVGAGGRFTKDVIDYLRLQELPYDSTFLLKTEAQFAGDVLDSTEEYQLGGISNLRGFEPGEAVGDNGQTVTAEFGLPLYGLPKELKVPFTSGTNLYDALRLAAFYDWGHVSLREPQPGTAKETILDDYGFGIRLTLPQNLLFRLDVAWPVTGDPSDGRGEHTWVQISKQF